MNKHCVFCERDFKPRAMQKYCYHCVPAELTTNERKNAIHAKCKESGICYQCRVNKAKENCGQCAECAKKTFLKSKEKIRSKPGYRELLNARKLRSYHRRKLGILVGNQYETAMDHSPSRHVLECLKLPHSYAWLTEMDFKENSRKGAALEPEKYSVLPQYRHLVSHLK